MSYYTEQLIDKNTIERIFIENLGYNFPWHRDSEDRKIIVIESGDEWYYQEDNCLPELLKPGKTIKIDKLKFHRLIGGNKSLVIHIIKKEWR